MADVDPKPIGMMNSASRFYKNDNIPANSPLKKVAVESMQKRFALKPVISQYTPKEGEQDQLYKDKIARIVEQDMLLNKLASSQGAENMSDAINFAINAMGAMEGMGMLAGLMKKAPKLAANEEIGSMIYNKNTGRQQYFDQFGNESSIVPRRQIPEPDYTDYGNAYLQKNDPFAAPTNKSTLGDIRAFGGKSSKMPKK